MRFLASRPFWLSLANSSIASRLDLFSAANLNWVTSASKSGFSSSGAASSSSWYLAAIWSWVEVEGMLPQVASSWSQKSPPAAASVLAPPPEPEPLRSAESPPPPHAVPLGRPEQFGMGRV